MVTHFRLFLTLTFFMVAVLGCVSKSKFQTLEQTGSVERAKLLEQISALEGEKKKLEKEIDKKDLEIKQINEKVIQEERNAAKINAEKEKETAELRAQKEAEINQLKGTFESLVTDLKGEIEKGEIKVTQIQNKLSVHLVEKVLFDSGRAEVKTKGKEVLKKVGNILQTVEDKEIRIEGHTDNVPIGGSLQNQFSTNWELSTQRATNVLRYLQEKGGVDGKYLSAVGYGEYRPIANNENPEGRAENRRIDIILVPLDIQEVLKELE